MEGNRRLAACLILAGDARAEDQGSRREQYLPSKFGQSDELPVFIYDWSKPDHQRQVLPYLGIRHIVGPLQWDSFAKAAWVASVLRQKMLTMEEIMRMVGDKNRTMPRLLEGYYFANQVEDSKAYDSGSSIRRGRGSKPEYPFSWVYNALDYDSIREFIGLGPRAKVPQPAPVQKDRLQNAGELMQWMFGGPGKAPAITDSRDLQDLAKAVSHHAALRELRKGERISVALESSRPKLDRARERLEDAAELARGAFGLLPEISVEDSGVLAEPSEQLLRAASAVRRKLLDMQAGEEGLSSDVRK